MSAVLPAGAAALAAAGVAALVSVGALRWLLGRSLTAWHDLPNHRSLHAAPVPRIGGLGIHAGWIAALSGAVALGVAPLPDTAVLVGCLAVIAVSLVDDRRPMGPLPRLLVQAAAAALLTGSLGQDAVRVLLAATDGLSVAGSIASAAPGASASPGEWAAEAAGLAVVLLGTLWMMNLFNFMDGADGLAGGMAAFGFGTYALLAPDVAPALALASAAVAGAAVGFLVFNFPPARVFMGDAGSVPLGFLAAAFGLAGIAQGAWGAWLPPLAFAPFIVDATFTLARRALRGERVWQAHREHGYQKLILLGWSHRRCALAWYAVMAACGAVALVLGKKPVSLQWSTMAGVASLLLVMLWAIETAWRRRSDESPDQRRSEERT